MTRRRRLSIVAAAMAVALLAWLTPWSRAGVTGAATVTDALGATVWRPFAPAVEVHIERIAGTEADVYAPRHGDAPTVVFVPGAVPAGRDDDRVEHLARVLARGDRRVVVPELTVYDERLVASDVERLVTIVRELTAGDGQVVLVGISFGGSLALLAAADDRLDSRVAGVATFGAYADLIGVVQAATTGVSLVDGERFTWAADPRAGEVIRDELTSLLPPANRRAVRRALAEHEEAAGAGTTRRDGLAPAERALFELLTNGDPDRTYELAARLPEPLRSRLAGVSPVSVADQLGDVPIVAMHSRKDRVIPYGELRRLGRALPHARLLTVDGLEHAELELADPGGWFGALDDLWTMGSFAGRVLRWQEPTWPWHPG